MFADTLREVAASQRLYFLISGYLLFLVLRNCAPLLYQLFPAIVKQSVKQLCSDLMQTPCFSSCFFHHLLFFISLLVYPILWLIIHGMRKTVAWLGKRGEGGKEGGDH